MWHRGYPSKGYLSLDLVDISTRGSWINLHWTIGLKILEAYIFNEVIKKPQNTSKMVNLDLNNHFETTKAFRDIITAKQTSHIKLQTSKSPLRCKKERVTFWSIPKIREEGQNFGFECFVKKGLLILISLGVTSKPIKFSNSTLGSSSQWITADFGYILTFWE